MNFSRRHLTCILPAVVAGSAGAQPSSAPASSTPTRTFPYEELPVKKNGENRSLQVLDGITQSGFHFDMHETELGPGLAPHPPHHHEHEEMLMIRQGLIEVTVSGKSTRLGAGSVAYIASNEEHGWKNVGDTRAAYFVIAFGRPHS